MKAEDQIKAIMALLERADQITNQIVTLRQKEFNPYELQLLYEARESVYDSMYQIS